jgi:hypothetical protein
MLVRGFICILKVALRSIELASYQFKRRQMRRGMGKYMNELFPETSEYSR